MIDVLRAEGVHADLSGLTWAFADETGFRFRWVDNWMRFRGHVAVPLLAPLGADDVARLTRRFRAVWPDLVGAIGTLPLADPLTIVRDEVAVSPEGAGLTVAFDFEAD